ncbi:hypothetical protein FE633_20940 [Streptomyces montanus]|uniref:Uncharacterized protein n=1 Tax=Streptomyces montanus TaxID=2580423 RepID=A0A5R9FQ23_9ACTN|nr:hypothetical protein [Streptomyces montanus]TLS44236.1 hypothetical protein FE633_20940 [Streptomyces montanus]
MAVTELATLRKPPSAAQHVAEPHVRPRTWGLEGSPERTVAVKTLITLLPRENPTEQGLEPW